VPVNLKERVRIKKDKPGSKDPLGGKEGYELLISDSLLSGPRGKKMGRGKCISEVRKKYE